MNTNFDKVTSEKLNELLLSAMGDFENGRMNPTSLNVLSDQLKCIAYDSGASRSSSHKAITLQEMAVLRSVRDSHLENPSLAGQGADFVAKQPDVIEGPFEST